MFISTILYGNQNKRDAGSKNHLQCLFCNENWRHHVDKNVAIFILCAARCHVMFVLIVAVHGPFKNEN